MARPSSETNVAGRLFANSVNESLGVSFGVALVNGMNQIGARLPEIARALAVGIEADLLQSRRLETNRELALGAAEAVYAQYTARTPNRHSGPYRANSPGTKGYTHGRYSGILGPALSNFSVMTEGTTRSRIDFLNEAYLNREAPHWARLNFGAGSAHGANPKAYQVTLIGPKGGSYGVAVLELPDMHRDAIKMPAGIWTEGEGGGDEFTPFKKGTLGAYKEVNSRATQFADAGVKFIAREAGNAYARMLQVALENPRTLRAIEGQFGKPISARADIRGGGGISFEGARVRR